MNKNITEYQTLIFDCDGVILNSNKIKTQAFYKATKHFGHESAQALVDYHVANGGISRYLKFEYFLSQILGQSIVKTVLDDLLERFAITVKKGLMECEVVEGLRELREKTPDATWMIVSGGDQSELREVFAARELDNLFDGGIFGSPDNKDTILAREKKSGNIKGPTLFLGDSKYDFQAAQNANLDFLFISSWTEVKGWKKWCTLKRIHVVSKLKSLLRVKFIRGVQVYLSEGAMINKNIKITNKGVNNKLVLNKQALLGSKPPIKIEFIGSNNLVYLSKGANVKNGTLRFVGDSNELRIGEQTSVHNAYFLLDGESKILIGNNCMLSYQIEFRTTDAHSLIDSETGVVINPPKSITIGDHVWIGKGALIMQGVALCSNLVVGTKALVTKSFNEEFCAIAGVPAKVVRRKVGWKRESPALKRK